MAAVGRIILCAMALALVAASVASYAGFAGERHRLQGILVGLGVAASETEASRELLREPDRDRARLLAAWACLTAAFSPEALSDRAPERASSVERLLLESRHMATTVELALPAAYQAPLVQGGSAYLMERVRQSAALYEHIEAWERPLQRSVELAPTAVEPARLLAAAYLDVWYGLSDRKRDEARRLLARLFARSMSELDRLFPAWLRIAPSPEDAMALVPAMPSAWERVQAVFAERRDWESFVLAHDRRNAVLDAFVNERLESARKHEGYRDLAAEDYLDIVMRAEPDRLVLDRFLVALDHTPPGGLDPALGRGLLRWQDWAVALMLVGQSPLPPEAFARIQGAAGGDDPMRAAVTAIVAGDLPAAIRQERRVDSTSTEEWTPYQILKARLLLDRGDVRAAEGTLQAVPGTWRGRLPYILQWQRLVKTGALSDDAIASEAPSRLRASAWGAMAWRLEGETALLELLPDEAAGGLDLVLVPEMQAGGAAEISWDGTLVKTVAGSGPQLTQVARDVTPEPHLLRVRTVAGTRMIPGEVRLRAHRSADGAAPPPA